jgi:enoyl-CoA hydratase/carnithine racemase
MISKFEFRNSKLEFTNMVGHSSNKSSKETKMTERQYIKISVEDRIAVLTIDHPPVNALNTPTMQELNSALDELAADDGVKAIVITGAGQYAFVAGADINEIAALKGPEDARAVVLMGQRILNKIENMRKPVIAAINSVCLGGGNELAMACHMRVATDRARFGQPEINLGIIPGFGGTQRLPRLVGKAKALEMLLTGDMITAQEAHRIGLVNKVVPEGEVVKAAKDLAKKVLTKGQVAVGKIMEVVDRGLQTSLEKGLLLEADGFAAITATEDMREGVAAFLQKRQPKFQDR